MGNNTIEDAGAYLPSPEEIERLKREIRERHEASGTKRYEPRMGKQKSFGVPRKKVKNG